MINLQAGKLVNCQQMLDCWCWIRCRRVARVAVANRKAGGSSGGGGSSRPWFSPVWLSADVDVASAIGSVVMDTRLWLMDTNNVRPQATITTTTTTIRNQGTRQIEFKTPSRKDETVLAKRGSTSLCALQLEIYSKLRRPKETGGFPVSSYYTSRLLSLSLSPLLRFRRLYRSATRATTIMDFSLHLLASCSQQSMDLLFYFLFLLLPFIGVTSRTLIPAATAAAAKDHFDPIQYYFYSLIAHLTTTKHLAHLFLSRFCPSNLFLPGSYTLALHRHTHTDTQTDRQRTIVTMI